MALVPHQTATAPRVGRLAGAGFAVLLSAVIAGGCASPPPRPASNASVTMVNLTDHVWRIVFHPTPTDAPPAPRSAVIAARATDTIELRAGSYAIEQTVVGSAPDQAPRRLMASFAAGDRYEWPLATARAFGTTAVSDTATP